MDDTITRFPSFSFSPSLSGIFLAHMLRRREGANGVLSGTLFYDEEEGEKGFHQVCSWHVAAAVEAAAAAAARPPGSKAAPAFVDSHVGLLVATASRPEPRSPGLGAAVGARHRDRRRQRRGLRRRYRGRRLHWRRHWRLRRRWS